MLHTPHSGKFSGNLQTVRNSIFFWGLIVNTWKSTEHLSLVETTVDVDYKYCNCVAQANDTQCWSGKYSVTMEWEQIEPEPRSVLWHKIMHYHTDNCN
jgi:molecular chaperone DnaK (HSP70)